jgi:hypothetical protein
MRRVALVLALVLTEALGDFLSLGSGECGDGLGRGDAVLRRNSARHENKEQTTENRWIQHRWIQQRPQ